MALKYSVALLGSISCLRSISWMSLEIMGLGAFRSTFEADESPDQSVIPGVCGIGICAMQEVVQAAFGGSYDRGNFEADPLQARRTN
jgi:hypothetical protein